MNKLRRWIPVDDLRYRGAIVAVAAIVLLCGVLWRHAGLLGGGAIILCLMLRRIGEGAHEPSPDDGQENRRLHLARSRKEAKSSVQRPVVQPEKLLEQPVLRGMPTTTDALVEELLATGRCALLLRPEMKQHLTSLQIVGAVRKLDEAMALVPAGRVLLGQLAEQANSLGGATDADSKLAKRSLVCVETVYLDRYAVTNEQYRQFVDAGGYEQLEYWHEEALPALLDFVDQTGVPGPRFWYDGHYLPGEQRLPVVGVSWYEAAAYGRWVGKRLPTDAEWTKAGAWPVESSPGRIAQRRYPWGESFDVRRAHLYDSGHNRPVAVDEYPGGMSVGGLHQLIGNVWEWTATPLVEMGDATLHVSEAVMSIRGGAFDTYFENQATCHYQSGDHSLARRPNIGFRLALPMNDLEVVTEEDGIMETHAEDSQESDPPAPAPEVEEEEEVVTC